MHKVLLGALLAATCTTAAHAAPVYDAVTDFSTANGNPNNVWSYGYGTPGGSFTLLPVGGSFNGSPTWSLSTIPLIGTAYTGGTVAVPANDLWFHPGNSDAEAAILRFTAPTAGTYSLSGFFERADNQNGGGDGTGVTVYKNSSVLVNRAVLPAVYLSRSSFSQTTQLAAGDTLSFAVDRNFGSYFYDSTGLQLNIAAAVPEPATWGMMVIGFGLTGAAMRRRQKVAVSFA